MARAVRSPLESRTQRLKLDRGRKHWVAIGEGLSLGYRRGRKPSWIVRYRVGEKVRQKMIGEADDYQEADGESILTYFQATERAREAMRKHRTSRKEFTVGDAMAEYLEFLRLHRKSADTTKAVIDAHILPQLGDKKIEDLTPRMIRKWHESLAKAPARLRGGKTREGDPRARKATANRILTVLKAALNRAYAEEPVGDPTAWRSVKPFARVVAAKIRFLTKDECLRLVNACDPDLRLLVQAALLTGCRYGELAKMRVEDFDPDAKSVHVAESKSGKARHIPLTDDGVKFFSRVSTGRKSDEPMFTKNGKTWKRGWQRRPLLEACKRAGINPPASFHILRHTFASHLVMAGAPLTVVAHCLGHSDTRVTERHYAHLCPSYAAEVVRQALPTLGKVETDEVVRIDARR